VTDRSGTGRRPVVLGPGEGRAYPMGRISAVFKADGAETGQLYSISEWWLDPHTNGPGAHSHPEDDVFYVLAGTMSVLVGTEWIEASTGSFVVVPGNVTHDFENRGTEPAGVLNVSAPGNFEQHMPGIAQWFAKHLPAIRASEVSWDVRAPSTQMTEHPDPAVPQRAVRPAGSMSGTVNL
jgi:mannose-6-phosphate isomerase-like protein (cupin superfamily)